MNNILKYFLTLMLVVSVGVVASAQDAPMPKIAFSDASMQASQKKKVAVYMTGKDIDENYKKVIGSKLVTGITRSDSYAAVERTADFLAELDKEQGYQLSGAVSDNQIAQLGQQFGVNYVLVADISEVFESMFISARMIDVQTAQITSSTETSGTVSNIESLIKLSENIVLDIVGTPSFEEDAIKQQSVFTFDDLYDCNAPSGYHIATHDEIAKIIQNFQITGQKFYYPVYTDIVNETDELTQVYTVCIYKWNDGWWDSSSSSEKQRTYQKYSVVCRIITSASENNVLNLYYCDDKNYASLYSVYNYVGTYIKKSTEYLQDMNTRKPDITPGYVYFVKDK